VTNKRVSLSPAERHVLANVTALREHLCLSWRQLSDRLADLGHPVIGLSRVGRGERRIDLDDPFALALALGTTPAALIVLQDADDDDAEGC
jgi:hypothetical protein